MTKGTSEPGGSGGGGGGFHLVQPARDLESNFDIDISKILEDYLLKILSGGTTGEDEVNFSEAALLLQGSTQVYSRKVEYLYLLVLRCIEFLSKQRHQDDKDGEPLQTEESAVADEEDDPFWYPDVIPAEENIYLDDTVDKEVNLDRFRKLPADLVVLEGDCLDTSGDAGELESYLLSTTNLYRDFILLDTSDAVAVDEFLKDSNAGIAQDGASRETSTRKSFLSATRRSGGSARKSSAAKSQRPDSNLSPKSNCNFDDDNVQLSSPDFGGHNNCDFGFNMDDGFDAPRDLDDSDADDDDEEDPWKPLNPHEPGNLRVKPFRKVKASKKNDINVSRRVSMSTLFPLAKLHGPVSSELMEMWEMRHDACEQKNSQPSLYEKLRQSLINEGNETGETFFNTEDDNDDHDEYDSGNLDFDIPFMDGELPPCKNEDEINGSHGKSDEAPDVEVPNSQESLEDLCRSHLNALLASIAETEKQTEMAARVSTWKERIEDTLEEEDSRPPFDIRDYGERILDKLSLEESNGGVLSYSYLVGGQAKHDVARSFSSLLQLVNNREVDLVDGGAVCHTAANPFHVRLLKHNKNREGRGVQLRLSSSTRKPHGKGEKNKDRRGKSPATSPSRENRARGSPPPPHCKLAVKVGKVKLSPEAKRRRRSRHAEPVNSHSTG